MRLQRMAASRSCCNHRVSSTLRSAATEDGWPPSLGREAASHSMLINIYSQETDSPRRVAWLCDGNWRLPDHLEALEAWLKQNCATLKPGRYIADIGFTPREDALGGGAAFSPET